MTIGIDIRTLMDAQYSGVPEYTLNLIRGILRLDKENYYKLFYNSGRDISKRMPKFAGDNVEIIKTNYPNKAFNNIMQRVIGAPKLDRFLGVDTFFMPNIGFVALSPQCRKIITIHDLSFLRHPEFYSLKRKLWHRIINIKKLLKNFDVIVAVSENTKKDIVELGNVLEAKVQVIYSGIGHQYRPVDSHDNQLKKIKAKYNLPEKFILYLGTIEPRKNVSAIIKAFDKFIQGAYNKRDCCLVIAGAKGWKSQEVFQIWKRSKNKAKIRFLGYVNKDDKVYLYNLAALFVFPSFYEGFGFPPMEAMACGCPVITSHTASLPEIMGRAALMIDPYNISEIARATAMVINDQELRDNLTKRGLTAAENFSWEKTAGKYLQIFETRP